jgi:hypothetical protein
MCFVLTYFILLEAIAASWVCHQRNAIFGRGACIFVLTYFLNARWTQRIKCGQRHDGAGPGKWKQFSPGDAAKDALTELADAEFCLYKICRLLTLW